MDYRGPRSGISATGFGELEFGPRFDYQMNLDNGSIFSPYVTIKGIQTFKNKNTTATIVGSIPNTGETGFRARTELGFTLVKQEGYTILPLSIYTKGGLVKMEIGLGKGKKNYDKRQALAKKDQQRQMDRAMKERH